MSTTIYPHVEMIAGRPFIQDKKVRVTEIVLDWLAYHWDAEQIQRHHPYLSMAEIHAAFVYYFDHKEELDRQIAEELEEVDRIQAQTQNPVLQAKLRAKRNQS